MGALLDKYVNDNIVLKFIYKTIKSNGIDNEIDEDTIKDLSQDIWLSILTKPKDKLEKMETEGKLKSFILRMVILNLRSTTSRYYYNYVKPNMGRISIDTIETDQDDEWD